MPRLTRPRSLVLLFVTTLACGGARDAAAPAASASASASSAASVSAAPAATPSAAPADAAAQPAADEPNLLSFAYGAILVKSPPECGGGWASKAILDDRPTTGWCSPENQIANHTFVIELAERTQFKTLSFDTGRTDGEHRDAKDVVVEISDTGPDGGFTPLATAALKEKQDNQRVATASTAGRWVRLTIRNNHGAPDFSELMEMRGFGAQLTSTPFPAVSGTYATEQYGDFHIKQEGTSIIGCYEYDEGVLTGGIEGRVMKLTWHENGGPDDQGPALMVFSGDRTKMFGMWWGKGDTTSLGGDWNGTRKSDAVGSCPHMPKLEQGNAAKTQMAKAIEAEGRARIYGINFDTASDAIKSESKSTLDQIVAMLKENAAWKMTVEGHTDSVGGEAANQKLSERRAEAVKAYLVKAGIDASRLTAAGLGMSKPVASNDDAIGRAQNRRVELVKQ